MIIGVPREIKPGEQRVALTPAGVRALLEARQQVLVERGAGQGSSIRDEEYAREGASLVDVGEVWARAEMILKVKEPLPEEYGRMRAAQILFTYLHLAAAPDLARALQKADVVAIAYETVQRADGSLPLLAPMSEVAGRLAVQEGAFYLAKAHGGRGILLAGVPGVPPGNVVVVGAGVVGVNAARIALGLGADVSILDVNLDRLRAVDDLFHGRVITLMSNSYNLDQVLRRADLLVGAVLITGARAPVISTAPTSRSARRTTAWRLNVFDMIVTTRPAKRSSTARRRSGLTSRIDTSAPSPIARRAALTPTTPAPMTTTLPGGTPGTPESRMPRPP